MPELPFANRPLASPANRVPELLRLGRFSEAVEAAQNLNLANKKEARLGPELQALYADALQRTGQNQRAQLIVDRYLSSTSNNPSLCARYHFVLGNICRENGNSARTVEHFQVATNLAGSDLELACWSQLRLIAAISDLSGNHAALARLDQVRRTLTRFGDSGPFAALHLWLAETDTSNGNIEQARKHLDTARNLLTAHTNIWLQGYLAINQSAVHFFAADFSEAYRYAQEAIRCAEESGHLASRRAAYSNFGYIQFSTGHLSQAQESFEHALTCCEPGTPSETVILDNIADVALHQGDLGACRAILSKLEKTTLAGAASARSVNTWVQHTTIRLLLREGRAEEARALADTMLAKVAGLPNSRLWAESHLVAAEALLANGEVVAAANTLSSMLSPQVTLSSDLYAEAERIRGAVLSALGVGGHARLHYQYSAFTFQTIGHVLGKQRTLAHFQPLPGQTVTGEPLSPVALDRFRILFDMHGRTELFANEAYSLLEELCCSDSFMLSESDGTRTFRSHGNCVGLPDRPDAKTILLGSATARRLTLTFVPKDDAYSKLVSASFHRVVWQIANPQVADSAFTEQTVTWTKVEGAQTGQTALFASDQMFAVFRTIKQIANADVSILVTGETGTGKEVVAKTIHEYSRRSGCPFVPFNCAAVPRELLESQLFGYKKGSFSGATDNFQGIVRAANGGTLLLDEFGEIPFDLQAKLLRFLDEREVHPIGETRPAKVDVRLIFATNMNLEEAVKQKRFREDLFYRISIVPIHIPPLRERKEEIPSLVNLFAQRFSQELAKEPIRFSDSAVELLILFSWPGNVRQLANEVRRLSVLMDSGSVVKPEHLSNHLHARSANSTSGPIVPRAGIPLDQTLSAAVELLETEMIKEALRRSGGNMSTAAASLGISRKGLYLKRLRLGPLVSNSNRRRP